MDTAHTSLPLTGSRAWMQRYQAIPIVKDPRKAMACGPWISSIFNNAALSLLPDSPLSLSALNPSWLKLGYFLAMSVCPFQRLGFPFMTLVLQSQIGSENERVDFDLVNFCEEEEEAGVVSSPVRCWVRKNLKIEALQVVSSFNFLPKSADLDSKVLHCIDLQDLRDRFDCFLLR